MFAYIKPWATGNCLVVEELCVSSNFRRLGVAKKLISDLINKALTNYNIIQMRGETCGDTSQMPFSWYKRIGFNKSQDTYLIIANPKDVLEKII